MKHTVDNNILRVLGLAGDPVQRIGAGCIPAHEEKALGVLDGRVFGNGQPEILALQKVGVADCLGWLAGLEDVAIAGCEASLGHSPTLGGESYEGSPCRCGSPP